MLLLLVSGSGQESFFRFKPKTRKWDRFDFFTFKTKNEETFFVFNGLYLSILAWSILQLSIFNTEFW